MAAGRDEHVIAGSIAKMALSAERLTELTEEAHRELGSRISRYRGDRALPELIGREVVLVDDALAIGVTAEAVLLALRVKPPGRLVLSMPVCAPGTLDRLVVLADEVVWALSPSALIAVGQWYQDFSHTTDDEVIKALCQALRQIADSSTGD